MKYPPISIITPVSDRIETWPLYVKFISRAISLYDGEVQVVIADDSQTPMLVPEGWTHIVRPPAPFERDPRSIVSSFTGNLRAALSAVTHDYLFIWEDDDWHSADYLRMYMTHMLAGEHDMLGEGHAIYYHIWLRRWIRLSNERHASLCQTAINRSRYDDLLKSIDAADTACDFLVDARLWTTATNPLCLPESKHCIGIKGAAPRNPLAPGHDTQAGIGSGHNPKANFYYNERSRMDYDGSYLISRIGLEDATLYFDVCRRIYGKEYFSANIAA